MTRIDGAVGDWCASRVVSRAACVGYKPHRVLQISNLQLHGPALPCPDRLREILAALARHDLRCDERLNCAMAKAAVAIRAVLLLTLVK